MPSPFRFHHTLEISGAVPSLGRSSWVFWDAASVDGPQSALTRSLQRDPLLEERVRRLPTIPRVGRITALTWALDMGDIPRFLSIRQAISYCGLCGDEKKSAQNQYAHRFRNSATNMFSVSGQECMSMSRNVLLLDTPYCSVHS